MIESFHISNNLTDQGLEQGMAGFPKDAAQRGERPMQGRDNEAWMANVVAMSLEPGESTQRTELSSDDKRLMVDLKFAWKALIGKYRAPIERALEEMNTALLHGETSIDVLGGYPKTGAPLNDSDKAYEMLDEIRKTIVGDERLSKRLNCGITVRKDKYHRFTVTIQKAGV